MKYSILKDYEQTQSFVSQVCKIADQNKKSFGFLPESVYEQMASKGQLWIAVCEKGNLQGYLMFGGKMPTLKISQIFINPSIRGNGLGKILIENLIKYAEKNFYHTISARVASDLHANLFWEASNFKIQRQEQGGKTTDRTINIRAYKLPINDLLPSTDLLHGPSDIRWAPTILPNQTYAIDLNPIFDMTQNREHCSSIQKVFQMSLSGDISLCLTPEFKKEIQRHGAKFTEDPIAKFASNIPVMGEIDEKQIDNLSEKLRGIIFPDRKVDGSSSNNDSSDLSHLAYCVAGGINGFITREKALLRANTTLKKIYRISILSPDELIPEIDSQYQPIKDIPLSSRSVRNYTPKDYDEVITFLTSLNIDEGLYRYLNLRGITREASRVHVARLEGKIAGILSLSFPSKATQIGSAYLFVDESSKDATAIIDHFLEVCFRHKTNFIYRLDLHISEFQIETNETAVRKGFLAKGEKLSKLMCNEFVSMENWLELCSSIKTLFNLSLPDKMPKLNEFINTGICITDSNKDYRTVSLFDFETLLSPMFCNLKGRGCLLVPIKENYANQLLGNTDSQLSLLDCSEQVLMLEKAYFRAPSKNNYFTKGTILAFYVSKTIKELVGFAREPFSDVMSVDEALISFKRQGVLSRHELGKFSDSKGNLHVFTFDNFFEFNKRVSFSQAKKLGLISKANLVSVEKIDHIGLEKLIREAF